MNEQTIKAAIEKGIIKLSSLSKEKRLIAEKFFEDTFFNEKMPVEFRFVKPSPEFDEHGLRFDLPHLKDIGLRVLLLPLEYMANYADEVTITAVDSCNKDFVEQISDSTTEIQDMTDEEVLQKINATSVGNLAYISIHLKNQEVKDLSEAILNRLHKAFLNQLMKIVQKFI
jgi:hypothetical protein